MGMRRSRAVVLLLLATVVLAVVLPSASVMAGSGSAVVERTRFHGLYFPAGMEGTETDCPYTWMDMPPMCVMAPGSQTVLPDGRLRIRGMELYELALAYGRDGTPEPRKTGYDLVVADANLDSTFSGPTWGTWNLYSFGADVASPADDVLMFSGVFIGRFKNGIPAVRYFGNGTGIYDGQFMFGRIGRVPAPWNMFGWIYDLG
jgi:hypothetical protein